MASETYRIDIEAHFKDKTGDSFKKLGDKCKNLNSSLTNLGEKTSKALDRYTSGYGKALSRLGASTSKALNRYTSGCSDILQKYNDMHAKALSMGSKDYTIGLKLHQGDYKHLMRQLTHIKSSLTGLTTGRKAIGVKMEQPDNYRYTVPVGFQTDGLNRGLSKTVGSLTDLTRRSWRVTVGIIDEVTGPLRGIMNGLTSFQAFAAVAGAGLAANYGLVQPVNAADSYSRNLFGMQSLLGEKAGQRMMDEIDRFAIATPYTTSSVLDNARRMLAMGWNQNNMLTDLDTIGDTVAALGGTDDTFYRVALALGQVKTKGKLYAQEINQLAEAGIAAKKYIALGLGYGNTDEGLLSASVAIEKGIPADQALSYLLQGMQEYDGMMAKVNDLTAGGILSEIKDTFEVYALRQWGQGLQTEVVDGLGRVRDYLDLNQDKIIRLGGSLRELARDSFDWFEDAAAKGVDIVSTLTNSSEFRSASTSGKMGLLWDNLIAEPFHNWWDSKGNSWASSVATTVASSLVSAFGSAFKLAWEAMPFWGKMLLAGWGVGKVANIASGVRDMVGLFSAGGATLGKYFGLAETAGSAGGLLGLGGLTKNAKFLSMVKVLGAGAAAYSGVSGIVDIVKSTKTEDPYESKAQRVEGIASIVGTILGGAIGSFVAPGAGTIAGAGIGGSFGSLVGSWSGSYIKNEGERLKSELEAQSTVYDDLINKQKTYLQEYQTVDSLLASHQQITKDLNALKPYQIDEINIKEQERADIVGQLAQIYPDFVGIYEQENGLLSQQIDLLRQRSYEQLTQNQAQLEVEANSAKRELDSGRPQANIYDLASQMRGAESVYQEKYSLLDQEKALRNEVINAASALDSSYIMHVGEVYHNTDNYDKANKALLDFYARNEIKYDPSKTVGKLWTSNYNPMEEYLSNLGQRWVEDETSFNDAWATFEKSIYTQQQSNLANLATNTLGKITTIDPTGYDTASWTEDLKNTWRDAAKTAKELELEPIEVKFQAETGFSLGGGLAGYASLPDKQLSQLLQSYREYANTQTKALIFDFKAETGLDWGTTAKPENMVSGAWEEAQNYAKQLQNEMDRYNLTNDLLTFKAGVGVEFDSYPYEELSSLSEESQTIFNRLLKYTEDNFGGDRTKTIPYLLSVQPELEVKELTRDDLSPVGQMVHDKLIKYAPKGIEVPIPAQFEYNPVNTGIPQINDQMASMASVAADSCAAVVGSLDSVTSSASFAADKVRGVSTALDSMPNEKIVNVRVNYSQSGSAHGVGLTGGSNSGDDGYYTVGGFLARRNAAGGIVHGKTLSWLAEEGYPETVIPLAPYRRQRALNLWEKTGEFLGADRKIETGGQIIAPQVQVSFQVTANNGADIVSEVEKHSGEIAQKVAKVLNEALQENFANTPVRTG